MGPSSDAMGVMPSIIVGHVNGEEEEG